MLRNDILGAVIAGGRSSRFGSDKALAPLDGRRLIDHARAGLAAQTDAVVVCGRRDGDWLSLPDRPRPGLGPLGGIAAALRHAAAHGFRGVLTSACDTPVVPADLAQHLVGHDPAIIAGQPLFGYWPARLANAIDAFLADGDNRAVGAFAARVEARRVPFDRDIPNINTIADLAALRAGRRLVA